MSVSAPEPRVRMVTASRYVTPLREGGSLPAIIEADDLGTYVLKFHGAGQGPRVLIAELVTGEIARVLGLPMPEIVFVELDPVLGRSEPDPEIQALILASGGLNLALDYLPGSMDYNPMTSPPPDPGLASAIVWFDAYITNVDRTVRNTNLLTWHRKLWLIDNGAALYFHYNWDLSDEPDREPSYLKRASLPFLPIRDHVLLPYATVLADADEELAERLTPGALSEIVALIPDDWLVAGSFTDCDEHRAAYASYLLRRLEAPRAFVREAIDARSRLL